MTEQITIRRAKENDITRIAEINSKVFLGDRDHQESAKEWATCWYKAFPLYQYFVIDIDGRLAGYAGWQIHGGFHRAEPVVELDQIGVDPAYQGRHLAPQLIRGCMRELCEWAKEKNNRIESHVGFVVWGYSLNFNAISAYAKEFTDGMCGFRTQFGNRAESMFRVRISIVRPVRD